MVWWDEVASWSNLRINNAVYVVVVLTSPPHTSLRMSQYIKTHQRAIHLLGVKVTLRYSINKIIFILQPASSLSSSLGGMYSVKYVVVKSLFSVI